MITVIETWKKYLDNKKPFGALLTDLSKDFACVNHELLTAKLHAYELDNSSLRLIHSYLNNRQQQVRVDNEFGTWSDIKDGVPQGPILGPLFFNIHICDLFYMMGKWPIANYADDTITSTGGKNIQDVITSLRNCALVLFKCFENNLMKVNSDKSHLLLRISTSSTANVIGDIIKNSESEKRLGITIDYQLNFEEHLSKVCDKASQKLNALARISSYMNINQRKRIMRAFISSQFEYCPLVWFFCSRKINNRMNRTQECVLRIVYKDYVSTFAQLLEKDSSMSIHIRNLQVLVTDIFKGRSNILLPIAQNSFRTTEPAYS